MTNIDIVRSAQQPFLQSGRPALRTGMEVEVHQKIKEGNKERIQKFKGIIIKTAGKSELETTITVRRKIGAFGVEKIFAVHSSSIDKIDVLRQFKVRRKSIKYIRDLTGKAARLKEVKTPLEELNAQKPLPTIIHEEEVVIVDEKWQAQVEQEVVAESGDHEEVVVTAQEVDTKEAAWETIQEIVEEAEEKIQSDVPEKESKKDKEKSENKADDTKSEGKKSKDTSETTDDDKEKTEEAK